MAVAMKQHTGRLIYIAIVFALIGGAILLRYTDPFFVRALRLIAFDNFQRLDPAPYDPNLPIRVVDIDEKSLSLLGQWPWSRTTVRDLLLELTSKGAAAVAFDVLFAEPDRTSLEEIVNASHQAQASAITSAMAGQPSNDELFAAALKETPSVLSIALGSGASTDVKEKAGFAFAGDDPRNFLTGFAGATRNLPEFENAAHGIGAFNWVADRDQVVRRVALVFQAQSDFRAVTLGRSASRCPGSHDIRAEGLQREWRDSFRTIDRASITFASAMSKCRQMPAEASISNSDTSTRSLTFPPGRFWPAKCRKKRSKAGSSLSEQVLLACSTYEQLLLMKRYLESIFTRSCSSIY